MATFGQGINPQLGAIDYSPILRGSLAGAQMAAQGSQMIGQGLANLGQEVGKGVAAYYKKQEIKKLEDDGVAFIQNLGTKNPYILQAVGIKDPNDTKAIKAGMKAVGGVENFFKMANAAKGEMDKSQAADILMRYGASGGASSYMGENGETLGSPEANMMAQNQYMAQTTQQLQQDKLKAEAQNLRLPQKLPEVSFQEKTANKLIVALEKKLGRAATEDEQASIYSSVQRAPKSPNITFGAAEPGTMTVYDPETNTATTTQVGANPQEEEKKQAKISAGELIGSMRQDYKELDRLNAIRNSSKSAGSNITSYLASSGFGQEIQRMLGGTEQVLRDKLTQAVPLVIQELKTATGMTAAQMNSDADIKLIRSAVGDAKSDIAVALGAMDRLQNRIVGGSSNTGDKPNNSAEAIRKEFGL